MTISNNNLRNVVTYQMSALATLQNQNCFIGEICNMQYNNFQNLTANLGDTVTFDLPPRASSVESLVAQFDGETQRFETLTVNKPLSSSYVMSNPEYVFNTQDYMDKFAKSSMNELGSKVESAVAEIAALAPYRFYGNGITPINSVTTLAQSLANFEDFGAANMDVKAVLPTTRVPVIAGQAMNQFVPDRNDELAQSWKLGKIAGYDCDWYTSNKLPTHTSGTGALGQNADTLLLTAVSADGTTLTFSGATGGATEFYKDDLIQFNSDSLRFLTFVGHSPSDQPVQCRVLADAAESGGNVTVEVVPALISTAGLATQNLSRPLAIGSDTAFIAASHRAGIITSGRSLFLATPQLPEMTPFQTASRMDPDTGVSVRVYYGAIFGQGKMGWVNDLMYGATQVPEYGMRILFPLAA